MLGSFSDGLVSIQMLVPIARSPHEAMCKPDMKDGKFENTKQVATSVTLNFMCDVTHRTDTRLSTQVSWLEASTRDTEDTALLPKDDGSGVYQATIKMLIDYPISFGVQCHKVRSKMTLSCPLL